MPSLSTFSASYRYSFTDFHPKMDRYNCMRKAQFEFYHNASLVNLSRARLAAIVSVATAPQCIYRNKEAIRDDPSGLCHGLLVE
jgi:hypothetical protein